MGLFFEHEANIARNAAGLAIKTSGSALAKISNETVYTIKGVIYSQLWQDVDITETVTKVAGVTTSTAFELEDGMATILSVYLNKDLSVSVQKGTVKEGMVDGALNRFTTSDINFWLNDEAALVGTLWIYNATGSTFTWGTTPLDDTGVYTLYNDCFASLWM